MLTLGAAEPIVGKTVGGRLAKLGLDLVMSLAFIKRWDVRRKVRKALYPALQELLGRLPELERPGLKTELESLLRTEMVKLATPAEVPDAAAIGGVLCRGVSVPTASPEVAGRLLVEALSRHLMSETSLQPVLTLRKLYHVGLRVERQEAYFGGGAGLTTMEALALPPAERHQAETAVAATAPNLLSWPQVLPDGRWLERPELAPIAARIESEEKSVTVLLGSPGVGKSALLARLGNAFVNRDGFVVVAIKADQLEPDVATEVDLAHSVGLDGAFIETVRRLAVDRRVVVLIDQMDAVADMVDLTSRRLTVLLEAIAALAEAPGVHIVASSRSFEYRHDPRFDRIKATTVTLAPPPWDEVAAILISHGIDPAAWPPDRREAMRAPQALSTFLALAQDLGSATQVAASYQGMLDQLWEHRLPEADTRSLISDMALAMAKEESLHQLSAGVKSRVNLVN